jgi:nucleotide-binding universal stress UspA family protein
MNDFVFEFNLTNYSTHIYNDTNIEKGIINFSNSINADIIGMCTHGRTGFAHFFNGSISEGLANHAIRPVITFKI